MLSNERMPDVGDIVLWYPDRNASDDMAQPAVVTRVCPPVIALGIISYMMTYVRPVDGVRHKNDPWLKDRPGAELRVGVWDWKKGKTEEVATTPASTIKKDKP